MLQTHIRLEGRGEGPTYAMSDIHGQAQALDHALDWIDRDRAGRPAMIHFLGDYVDYGPDSKAVLDRLVAGSGSEDVWWHFLLGNHEQMMLGAFESDDPEFRMDWAQRGGAATMDSYNLGTNPNAITVDGDLLDKHLGFLRRAALWIEDDLRIFVHAGLRDIGRGNYTMRRQNPTEILWIKPADMDAKWPSRLKKLVVHGHTPFDRGVPGRRLCIDGGAGLSGGSLRVAKFSDEQPTPIHVEMIPVRANVKF